MSKRIPSLSIADVEKSSAPDVWALNTTHGVLQSDIVLTASTRNGQDLAVFVPMTFVALNLTDQISKDLLLDSPSFRRAVAARGLTLISPETAAEINSSKGAKEELARIQSAGDSMGAESVSNEIAKNIQRAQGKSETPLHHDGKTAVSTGRVEASTRRSPGSAPARPGNKTQGVPEGVNPRVFAILSDESSNEREMLNKLKIIRYSLNANDAAYMEQRSEELGYPLLARAAESVRDDLEEKSEEDTEE